MSNTAVGQVYQRIIAAVIESSRTDFEEHGVGNDVLQMLQEQWQERLSAGRRAHFPWDPAPAAVQPEIQSAPSSTPQRTAQNSSQTASRTSPAKTPSTVAASPAISVPPTTQQNGSAPRVKQEPVPEPTFSTPDPSSQFNAAASNPNYASQRAAQLLQEKFGSQASSSIQSLQHATKPQSPQNGFPVTKQEHEVKHELANVKQEDTMIGLAAAQTDGTGDELESSAQWQAVVAYRASADESQTIGRINADHFVRAQVEAMQQRLEAGGLLVPLSQRLDPRRSKTPLRNHLAATPTHQGSPAQPGLLSFDGTDDDTPKFDTDDEDAINSDLDDPEDGGEDTFQNAYDGDMILCLYDKVQRVKNKWKCTLKDGVVTVDGKDYIFHKANGEFEW